MRYCIAGATIELPVAFNATTGAAYDATSLAADVRKEGDAQSDAPVASPTPLLLSHANYPNGCVYVPVDTTGYAAGTYHVFVTGTVDGSISPVGVAESFTVLAAAVPVDANIVSVGDDTDAADNLLASLLQIEVITVDDTNFTPTTTSAEFSGLVSANEDPDAYVGRSIMAKSGVNNGAYQPILACTFEDPYWRLTFAAFPQAFEDGDIVILR